MKVAIISDIHDNIPNLDKVLRYCVDKDIKKIICCGDFGSEETMKYLSENFIGKVRAVFGNADDNHVEYEKAFKMFFNIEFGKDTNEFTIDEKHVLVVHEPAHYEPYLSREDIQYIFYGHTHKPWQEFKDGKIILNPGNVSNFRYSPTFAVWETKNDKFELIQLNTLA